MLKSILFVSGLIGIGVGAAILLAPGPMFAIHGVELGSNSSLLSEIRAPGGALLVCGIFILSGVFVSKLTFTATVLSILLYLSYGTSRMLSMLLDGMPAEGLVQAAILEIVIGLFCVFALVKYRVHG